MDQHTHTMRSNSEIKFNIANLDIEDIDELAFENMSFKPVTDGLGFHDDRAEKKAKIIPRAKEAQRLAASKPATTKKTNLRLNSNPVHREVSQTMKPMESQTIHQKEIYEAFYGKTKETLKKKEEAIAKKNDKSLEAPEASKLLQAMAWLTDVLFLSLAVMLTGGIFALISGLDRGALLQVLPLKDLMMFASGLFILYYLFYFTVLDLGTSPGKAIMGTKLVRVDGKQMRVSQTFVRSVVSLVSFIALGVPLIMDFQGKLSDTKLTRL